MVAKVPFLSKSSSNSVKRDLCLNLRFSPQHPNHDVNKFNVCEKKIIIFTFSGWCINCEFQYYSKEIPCTLMTFLFAFE